MDAATIPRIICFGDSLTAGFQSPTADSPQLVETPYGRFLGASLGSRARVIVSGVCGEVTGEMVLRFRQDVLDWHPAFVIILGGTNDLGWNARPEEIMRNLVKMYEQARAAGIRLVAVTVPSLRIEGETTAPDEHEWLRGHIERRLRLNRLITEYCQTKGVACVDLFGETSEADTHLLETRYSNDGLHLTTEGYQRLATLLYDRVFAREFPDGPERSA